MNVDPTLQPVPQGNWFSRNWKWALALGCLLPLLCCGGSLAVGAFFLVQAVKDEPAYLEVQKRVGDSPPATETLGRPIVFDGFPMASVQSRGGATRLTLTQGVHGPKGSAQLIVDALRKGKDVTYNRFELVTTKGEHVDLRDKTEPEPTPGEVDPSNPDPHDPPMPDNPEDE